MQKILKKLGEVMKDIPRIEKDAENKFDGFRYASEKAIKEALHTAFVKHGILFMLDTGNVIVLDDKTITIDCEYRFFDIDSGESVSGKFIGAGLKNKKEKGVYGAVTGAIKYILTSTFLIPTGNDPDGQNETPTKRTATKQNKPSDLQKKQAKGEAQPGIDHFAENEKRDKIALNNRLGKKFLNDLPPTDRLKSFVSYLFANFEIDAGKYVELEKEITGLTVADAKTVVADFNKGQA